MIERRLARRENNILYQGSDKIQQNYWELSILNQFMHRVYLQYREVEFERKKKSIFGKKFLFMMRFIGKVRRLAQRVRIRLTFKRVVKHMHRFVVEFRNIRRLRF